MKSTVISTCLALLISVSVFAQKDRKADIMAANEKFMAAYSNGAAAMGDLYTADAQLFPPNADIVKGSQAIGGMWKSVYGSGIKKAKLETLEAQQEGEMVIETGKYTLYGANDVQFDMGKYLVVWKKENGGWKLYRDIFNTSIAPAVAAK